MISTVMVSNIPPPWPESDRLQVNPKNGRPASMISEGTYKVVKENATLLDSAIIYDRDFNYNLCVSFRLPYRSAIDICSVLVSKPWNGRTC
jgi:hypothetical protein